MGIAAMPLAFANVDGRRVNIYENQNYLAEGGARKKNFLERTINYNNLRDGSFRVLQGAERVMKAVIEIMKHFKSSAVGFCQKFADKCGTAWTMLTIPRLPEVTVNMRKSIQALKTDAPAGTIPGAHTRKVYDAIKNTADACAAYLYTVSLFTGSMAWKTAGDVPDLINNVVDARNCAQDLSQARKMAQSATAENVDQRIQTALQHTTRYQFLKTMKAVCSVVSGALGLSLLAFGGPVLPALALITVSLASTVFSILGSYYKEGSPFEMVDFFKVRHVQQLAAPAA